MRPRLAAVPIIAALIAAAPALAGRHPEPSIYPIAWQLDFKHGLPKRIVVDNVGYWYLTYTVTNNTGQEQIWAPKFDMMANDGAVIPSDRNIPAEVFDRINATEKNRFLQPVNKVAGILRQGPDQAKDGVAIWKEPNPRMGEFKVFVANLSGEYIILTDDDGKTMKDPKGEPVIVRKTLELDYAVYGSEFYPQRHEVHEMGQKWMMR